jgi:hypothetical protein
VRRCLAKGCGNWPRLDTCFAQRQIVYLALDIGIDWRYGPQKKVGGRLLRCSVGGVSGRGREVLCSEAWQLSRSTVRFSAIVVHNASYNILPVVFLFIGLFTYKIGALVVILTLH